MGYIGNRPTAVPLTSADIQDSTISLSDLSASGTASSSTFLRGDNSWVAAGADFDTAITINDSGNDVDFRVESNGDANCLIVDGSGDKVGIGEDVPEGKLHIFTGDASVGPNGDADELVVEGSGNSGISILSGNSSQGGVYFGDDGDDNIGQIFYDHSDNELKFTTAATFGMRLSGSGGGKLWIGNDDSDPTAASTSVAGLYLANNVTSFMSSFNTHPLVVHNSTATNSELEVIDIWRKGAKVGGISGSNVSTTYATSSDYRLKENETSITDGIDRVKQLKSYRFNFKANADKTVDGFFAHEVSSIVPEAITGEKDAMAVETRYTADDVETQGDNPSKKVGDAKTYSTTEIDAQGIDQAKLVPLLTSALQEAITKIETLEAKVAVLEG